MMPETKRFLMAFEVLMALEQGACTSAEIASLTGVSKSNVTSALNDLRLCGVARIAKRNAVRSGKRGGRPMHLWEMAGHA